MSNITGIVFPFIKGPFQNNGASPWYTVLGIGSPPQELKIAIDSGTNIAWTTSTLCPENSCQHYAGGRFDYKKSSTFRFTDCLQRPFSFGPWGTMQVETGADKMTLPTGLSVDANMFFSADYSGSQFAQLDWDGGIGLPSSSAYVEGRSTFLFQDLMIQGHIDPKMPFVAFDTNPSTKTGVCQMGGFDPSKATGPHLFLPWAVYSAFNGVEYLWTSPLNKMIVGNAEISPEKSKLFSLDTGSSQFKGDDEIMNSTLSEIASQGNPQIEFVFDGGYIQIGPEIYNVLIEEGPDKGKTLPQFNPLGLTNLALVGSVLMDFCYCVFQYEVVLCDATTISLKPVGMHLFNQPGLPPIIHGNSARKLGPVQPTKGKSYLLPTPGHS